MFKQQLQLSLISYSFRGVISRSLHFMYLRFGITCLFHLHRWCKLTPQSVPKRRHINSDARESSERKNTTFRTRRKFEIKKFNPLTPNDDYSGRTAPLTSKRCILYIYLTNTGTEYSKHDIYCPFFPLQNSVCFINLTYLVPVLFTFYIEGALKLKKNNSGAKRLILFRLVAALFDCSQKKFCNFLKTCLNL